MNTRDATHNAKERTPPMASTPPDHDRERLIEVLQRELDAARSREQAALEREQVALERVKCLEQVALEREARLIGLMEWLRDAKLLPLERTPPQPVEVHGRSQRYWYRDILALLQDYPEGLHRLEIQQHLQTSDNLSDSLVNLVGRKRLIRVAKGTYALPTSHGATQT